MAVVGIAVEKRGSPGTLRETATGFSISRQFIVRTSDAADGPIVVDRAVGLPQRGHRYRSNNESHPWLFCMERTIRRVSERGRVWLVEAEYRTPDPNNKEQQKNEQGFPEFELPVISGGTTQEMRDVRKTAEGTPRPIVNPNGELYKPHPQKPFYFPTLFIQRNEPITAPVGATQLAYCGKLNSDEFWGLPAGKWMCQDITWELASRTLAAGVQVAFLVVSYQFTAKDTHDIEYLRISGNYWTGAVYPSGHSREGQKILEAFETKNGWGDQDFIDEDGYPSLTPSFDEFPIFERVPFAALNLPQSPRDAVPR